MLTSIVETVVRPGLAADHAMMAARSQLRPFLTQPNSEMEHTTRGGATHPLRYVMKRMAESNSRFRCYRNPVRGSWQDRAMEAPPPGFVRVVLACRACGEVDVCDVQPGAMSPERLRAIWRCFACAGIAESRERPRCGARRRRLGLGLGRMRCAGPPGDASRTA